MKKFFILMSCLTAFMSFIGCPDGVDGDYTFPIVYDVTVDKTNVHVGDEITVSFYVTTSDFPDTWSQYYVKNNKLVTDESDTGDFAIIYFIRYIQEEDLDFVVRDGRTECVLRDGVSYLDYHIVKSEQVTRYHFDKQTRIVTATVIVPENVKTGCFKINFIASYGIGFCPKALTIIDTTSD